GGGTLWIGWTDRAPPAPGVQIDDDGRAAQDTIFTVIRRIPTFQLHGMVTDRALNLSLHVDPAGQVMPECRKHRRSHIQREAITRFTKRAVGTHMVVTQFNINID